MTWIIISFTCFVGLTFFRWGLRVGYRQGFTDANDAHEQRMSTFIINQNRNYTGGWNNGNHQAQEAADADGQDNDTNDIIGTYDARSTRRW